MLKKTNIPIFEKVTFVKSLGIPIIFAVFCSNSHSLLGQIYRAYSDTHARQYATNPDPLEATVPLHMYFIVDNFLIEKDGLTLVFTKSLKFLRFL